MRLWIARDLFGGLFLYDMKPTRADMTFITNGSFMYLDKEKYPEVTWENSPIEVETLIKQ